MRALRWQNPIAAIGTALLLAVVPMMGRADGAEQIRPQTQAADSSSALSAGKGHPWLQPQSQDSSGKPGIALWERSDGSELRGTLVAEVAVFLQGDGWYGNMEENVGADSSAWWESQLTPGLEGNLFLDDGGELFSRVSAVYASTDGIDAKASSPNNVSETLLEEAYIGWRSGALFSSLGSNFLSVSAGRQKYQVGTGFLFWGESSNGGKRGGSWKGERHAADRSLLINLKSGQWRADLVYFKADDYPNTNTQLGGATMDYAIPNGFGNVGGGYYALTSDLETRDSMKVYDLRFAAYPLNLGANASATHMLKIDGEYVYQDNDDVLQASGWYLAGTYAAETLKWQPSIGYRYASWEGDDPNSAKSEAYDPLFTGFNDWSLWPQGEIVGEWVLKNTNLNSHMIKFGIRPTQNIAIHLIYYHLLFDNAEAAGVENDTFANEWNLTLDWHATDQLAFSFVAAVSSPDRGARQYTGGSDDWVYGLGYVKFSL